MLQMQQKREAAAAAHKDEEGVVKRNTQAEKHTGKKQKKPQLKMAKHQPDTFQNETKLTLNL
mgnify:CR=1 FL=1